MARERTSSVFATPGSPSSRTCPLAKMATSTCSITGPCPAMALPTSALIACACVATLIGSREYTLLGVLGIGYRVLGAGCHPERLALPGVEGPAIGYGLRSE